MQRTIRTDNVVRIAIRLRKLHAAIAAGSSRSRCLRLWSEFIRERDGNRCVDCHSTDRLSAHHICRKSFIKGAELQTGNGITFCTSCHREMHAGFNGRPDLNLPVDAQGGEKLHKMERFYGILTDDAVERDLTREEFYFLSNDLLLSLKRMQDYELADFPGSRIEQAYLILAEGEHGVRRSILEANGGEMPDRPLLPGGFYLVYPEQDGQSRKGIVVQNYVPRWPV